VGGLVLRRGSEGDGGTERQERTWKKHLKSRGSASLEKPTAEGHLYFERSEQTFDYGVY